MQDEQGPMTPNLSETTPLTTFSQNIDKKDKKKVEWSPENEKILVEWCDIAQCYKWLNNRAHSKLSKLHAYYTIPAIVLSTITGTASFAQTSLPDNYKLFAPMVIGTINIAVGILATIQQYLKISELNEAHRVATIAWDKFARNIRIELAKAPSERPDAGLFLKHNRDEYDRLMETSPSIPEDTIKEFTTTFSIENQKDPEKKRQFKMLKRPDICDIIISAEENRHHWYKELDIANDIIEPTEFEERMERDLVKMHNDLRQKEADLLRKEEDMKNKFINEIQEKEKKVFELEEKKNKMQTKIEEYIQRFQNAQGREPLEDEIIEHFHDEEQTLLNLVMTERIFNRV